MPVHDTITISLNRALVPVCACTGTEHLLVQRKMQETDCDIVWIAALFSSYMYRVLSKSRASSMYFRHVSDMLDSIRIML